MLKRYKRICTLYKYVFKWLRLNVTFHFRCLILTFSKNAYKWGQKTRSLKPSSVLSFYQRCNHVTLETFSKPGPCGRREWARLAVEACGRCFVLITLQQTIVHFSHLLLIMTKTKNLPLVLLTLLLFHNWFARLCSHRIEVVHQIIHNVGAKCLILGSVKNFKSPFLDKITCSTMPLSKTWRFFILWPGNSSLAYVDVAVTWYVCGIE